MTREFLARPLPHVQALESRLREGMLVQQRKQHVYRLPQDLLHFNFSAKY